MSQIKGDHLETTIGKTPCDGATLVLNNTVNSCSEADVSNTPFALDGDMGINTSTITGVVVKETVASLDDRITGDVLVRRVLVSSRGVRGNSGATSLSTPRGPLKGPKGSEMVDLKVAVNVPESGAKVVHKVATKFIEGITPMATRKVLEVVIKVVEMEENLSEALPEVSKVVKEVSV